MFKNRSFMLGLGIGIIAGALLLQLMLLAQSGRETLPTDIESATNDAQNQEQATQTEENPSDSAEVPASDTPASTEVTEQPEEPDTEAPSTPSSNAAETPDSGEEPTSSEPSKPNTSATPTAPEKTADADIDTETQAPATPNKPASSSNVTPQKSNAAESSNVSFEIQSGMNLQNVSQALANAGIIDDAAAFERRAQQAGVSGKLQIGNYSFSQDDSFADIILEISTPKNE
ncbi:hypothetical protein [Saccharibacillus sp. JS10]|uniref:hypothetical protein n=1 Tax=Saccharibacillus sp. JS10 TaxID=2950552 RepID=UPI0021088D7D|nr:hypothetical protein [Saccharibacillus sp. JS10]MCQ4087218.1 hypothetical protein [Saccharibacillus sp. JS10]